MKTRIINASTELKNEPSAHKRTMSSVEITEMTGKRHSDVMRSIRAMEPAWVKIENANLRRAPTKTKTTGNALCIY